MRFQYRRIEKLPPLAWYAEVKNGKAVVLHGKQVEIATRYFVEGAWSGLFAKAEFHLSDWFCGTGGIIEGNKIVFSTPTHMTSGLFMSKWGGGGTEYPIVCTS